MKKCYFCNEELTCNSYCKKCDAISYNAIGIVTVLIEINDTTRLRSVFFLDKKEVSLFVETINMLNFKQNYLTTIKNYQTDDLLLLKKISIKCFENAAFI